LILLECSRKRLRTFHADSISIKPLNHKGEGEDGGTDCGIFLFLARRMAENMKIGSAGGKKIAAALAENETLEKMQ